MGRLWYVPFKKHADPVSMNRNWTSLEEYLNSLELKEVGPIGGGEKTTSVGAPSASDGEDGDWRYTTSPSAIYIKVSGAWVQMFAKYTDPEAVTAMGVKGDSNPLHHDRYTDAEAISVAGGAEFADNLFKVFDNADITKILELQLSTITTGTTRTWTVPDASGIVALQSYVDTGDATAIHGNVASEIDAITLKAAAVAADLVLIEDSAAALVKKKVLRSGLYPFKDSPVGATLMGISAGAVNTATTVTAFGYQALKANTTGISNTAFGHRALLVGTTHNYNVAVGAFALTALTTGSNNTGIGYTALLAVTTGSSNTAVGANALRTVTTGFSNTVAGVNALRLATTASLISAFGVGALYAPAGTVTNATTTGSRQTAFGTETGQASATQRNDIVAVGYRALIDANDTVAIGSSAQALHANAVALGKGIITTAASQLELGATHIEITEMTAPAAGATNSARIYAEDNGSGKTRLMVIFATGAAQQIALEP